ncbi:hypothetical protein BKA82DRAFT_36862 [Pisolithus tinctorius]|uniref:Uncharacterized protein n=1 Tax=Pisolithus tinctorius Marx 270 TaxID=870435 RepID=A0A0C3I620_PISTI|nr:hypothetical protein BKA82DRAFT_36862 [Pisolithus tinctorius]KIN92657.1 hypothetical protein M404DRAFT_36862 [Pisolithus tinctorius Marx 270]
MAPLTIYEPKSNRVAVKMVSMHPPPPTMTPLTLYEPKSNRVAVKMSGNEDGQHASATATHNSTHFL